MRGYYDGPSKNNEIDLNQSSNNRNEQRMDLKVHNLHVRVCHGRFILIFDKTNTIM